MKLKWHIIISLIVGICLITLFTLLIRNGDLQLLNPQGYIAQKQSVILMVALFMGVFIGIPVVATTLYVVLKYSRDDTTTYSPDQKANPLIIATWWIAPSIVIFFWALMGWQSTHLLDPYKPIPTNVPPITIQVVALQWKWLFIYPQEHIATVNFIEFPVNTPVDFQLTADNAPMNSFWIPSLGSQIYAMTGMVTQLHLLATNTGKFPGQSAEISGDGFAGMTFSANSVSEASYMNWLQTIKKSGKDFNYNNYVSLSEPSSYISPKAYNVVDDELFNQIVDKYMAPSHT